MLDSMIQSVPLCGTECAYDALPNYFALSKLYAIVVTVEVAIHPLAKNRSVIDCNQLKTNNLQRRPDGTGDLYDFRAM